jgi:hypothetical protein
MPPRSTKAPIPKSAIALEGAEYPYGVNARLGEPQAQYLNAIRRDLGIGTSAAIRYAIDRAIESKEAPVPFTSGVMEAMGFEYVPELDHIEFKLQRRDGDTGQSQVLELRLDEHLASELLADLTDAVTAARAAAETDA